MDIQELGPTTVGPLVTSDVTLTGNTVHTNDATAFPLSDIYMAVDSQDPGHNTPTRIRGTSRQPLSEAVRALKGRKLFWDVVSNGGSARSSAP